MSFYLLKRVYLTKIWPLMLNEEACMPDLAMAAMIEASRGSAQEAGGASGEKDSKALILELIKQEIERMEAESSSALSILQAPIDKITPLRELQSIIEQLVFVDPETLELQEQDKKVGEGLEEGTEPASLVSRESVAPEARGGGGGGRDAGREGLQEIGAGSLFHRARLAAVEKIADGRAERLTVGGIITAGSTRRSQARRDDEVVPSRLDRERAEREAEQARIEAERKLAEAKVVVKVELDDHCKDTLFFALQIVETGPGIKTGEEECFVPSASERAARRMLERHRSISSRSSTSREIISGASLSGSSRRSGSPCSGLGGGVTAQHSEEALSANITTLKTLISNWYQSHREVINSHRNRLEMNKSAPTDTRILIAVLRKFFGHLPVRRIGPAVVASVPSASSPHR